MIGLLRLDKACARSSRYLRRPVALPEVTGWIAEGSLQGVPDPEVGVLVRADELDRHLERIAPDERLLTLAEAARVLRDRHGLTVASRTLITWTSAGVSGDVLPTRRCPWFRPARKLVHPADLAAFVDAHPGLGQGPGRRPAVRRAVRGR